MRTLAVLLLTILALPGALPGAEIDPHFAWDLTLEGGLPNGRDLRLFVRQDNRGLVGMSHAPTFNRMPHQVDISKLGMSDAGAGLKGTVKITIPSDGWVPKGGPLVCTYAIDVNPVAGKNDTYKGTCGEEQVEGAITAAKVDTRPAPGPARLHLRMENAIPQEGKPFNRKGRLSLSAGIDAEGKIHDLKAIPPGSITDTSFCARVDHCDMAVVHGNLTGRCTVRIDTMDAGKIPWIYTYTIDQPIIADRVLGVAETAYTLFAVPQADDKMVSAPEHEAKTFISGSIDRTPAPKQGEGLYTFRVFDLPAKNKYLVCYLVAKNGKFLHGFAASPNYNNATHTLDCSKLAFNVTGNVTGPLAVVVHPDPWVPKNQEDQPINVSFGTTQANRELTGTASRPGVVEELFVIDGWIDPLPAERPLEQLTLKLENALVGGSRYHNRAFVSLVYEDGKVTGGKVGNNHSKLKGTVTGGDLALKDGTLTGTVTVTIAPKGGVTEGDYSFAIDAPLVGSIGAGTFETTAPDGAKKTGRLWTAVKFAEGD